MRCLLFGHNPQRVEGTKDREGRFAVICTSCGNVFEEGEREQTRAGFRDFEIQVDNERRR